MRRFPAALAGYETSFANDVAFPGRQSGRSDLPQNAEPVAMRVGLGMRLPAFLVQLGCKF